VSTAEGSPRTIFVIRHGEKPPDVPPPHGVDAGGGRDVHSLVTRGWQRAGALATLFAPLDGGLRPGLITPTQLVAPKYDNAAENERTHQTLQPLSELLNLAIECDSAAGCESDLGTSLAEHQTGVTLVCWRHEEIPTIATGICPHGSVPTMWPDDRFDIVWSFTLDAGVGRYSFTQIPQLLLAGDSADLIPTAQPG
jgi:hypothetical protein